MRKFLALLLAVLMLATTMLSALAADEPVEPEVRTGVDGSVAADADSLDLVITEYLSDSSATGVDRLPVQSDEIDPKTYNAFTYIELYNRGEDDINLYDYSIARSYIYSTVTDIRTWDRDQQFDQKMRLPSGSIYAGIQLSDSNTAESTAPCRNDPNAGTIGQGEFAIIWFWNDYTVRVAQRWDADGKDFGGKGENGLYHNGFRDHYAEVTGKEIPEDTVIIAVYAGGVHTNEAPRFGLTTGTNTMYGLVNEEDPTLVQGFDVSTEKIYTYNSVLDEYTFHPAVELLWSWGNGNEVGILGAENNATTFVPANGAPVLYNRDQERQLEEGETFDPAEDYVEIGFVDSFRQAAVIAFLETPTPGTMEPYQWALVDPEGAKNADADKIAGTIASFEGDWVTPVLTAFAKDRYPDLAADEETNEEEFDVNLKDREEIENELNNPSNLKDPSTSNNNSSNSSDDAEGDKGGLSTGLLIGIIAGGVVVAAGIAVLVIVLVKKKGKKGAADDEADVPSEEE